MFIAPVLPTSPSVVIDYYYYIDSVESRRDCETSWLTLSESPDNSSDSSTVTGWKAGAGRDCCDTPWSSAGLTDPTVVEVGRGECVSEGPGLGTLVEMANWEPPRSESLTPLVLSE